MNNAPMGVQNAQELIEENQNLRIQIKSLEQNLILQYQRNKDGQIASSALYRRLRRALHRIAENWYGQEA